MHDYNINRTSTVLLCLLAACVTLGIAYRKYMYPFGTRVGALQSVYGGLSVYAGEHHGWFPQSDKGAYDALQGLFPVYCPSGFELAGISGNVEAVDAALRGQVPLDGSLTSWVYVPGFHRDDPPGVALLWERRGGFYADGKRNFFSGHAVLLLDGSITNVAGADWDAFLRNQEELRRRIMSRR
jgi:hypothetical protein